MALERIDSVVNIPEIQRERDFVISALKDVQNELVEISKKGAVIELKLGNTKSLSDFNTLMKQQGEIVEDTTQNLVKQAQVREANAKAITAETQQEEALIKVQREDLKLSREIEAQKKREEKAAAGLTGEYRKLSDSLNLMRARLKDMLAAGKENDIVTKQLAVDVQALDGRLKSIDATVGQYQRSVGNYNMVGAQFNQLSREMTNIGISLRTTIQALSNNMGYFAESLIAARKQGQSWKDIVGSMTTGSNLLILGINLAVAAFTFFATKLVTTQQEVAKTSNEMENLTNSIKKLAEAEIAYQESLRAYDKTSEAALKRDLALKKAKKASDKEVFDAEQALFNRQSQSIQDQLKIYGQLQSFLINAQGKTARQIDDLANQLPFNLREEAIGLLQKAADERIDISDLIVREEIRLGEKLNDKLTEIEVNKLEFANEQREKNKKANEKTKKEAEDNLNDFAKAMAQSFKLTGDASTPLKTSQIQDSFRKITKYAQENFKTLQELEDERHKKQLETWANEMDVRKRLHGEKLAQTKEEIQAIQSIANSFISLSQIENNRSKNRLENINRELELVNEAYQYEVDRIQNSALTAEDKERRIQEAQAETQSKQADLRAKEREERRKQAEFDKAIAITQIIINTAAAVVMALLDPKAPLIKAAAVGAAGAAQLAIAAATPIPAFAEGDPEGKKTGGLALVGEKEPELMIDRHGNAMMVNKPAVMDLEPRTRIFNQQQINELLGGLSAPMIARILNTEKREKDLGRAISKAINDGTRETVKAIRNSKASVKVGVYGMNDAYYKRMVKGQA